MQLRDLLDATSTIVAATGILNLWMHTAAEVGASLSALDRRPSRPHSSSASA